MSRKFGIVVITHLLCVASTQLLAMPTDSKDPKKDEQLKNCGDMVGAIVLHQHPAASHAEWQNPYSAFAPSAPDLYTKKATALSEQLTQKKGITADLAAADLLLQGDETILAHGANPALNKNDSFKKYRRNARFDSPGDGLRYDYSDLAGVQRFLGHQVKSGQSVEGINYADVALKYLHENSFAEERKRRVEAAQDLAKVGDNFEDLTAVLDRNLRRMQMRLMAESGIGSNRENPAGQIGWLLPVFFTREATPEQRLDLAIMARGYGYGELGDRIVAWQMMRMTDVNAAYDYFHKYFEGRGRYYDSKAPHQEYEAPKKFMTDFAARYFAQLPDFDSRVMAEKFFNSSAIGPIIVDDYVWASFKASVEQHEFPEQTFEVAIRDVFVNNRKTSEKDRLLRELLEKNPSNLDQPMVHTMMQKYPAFQKWVEHLIS